MKAEMERLISALSKESDAALEEIARSGPIVHAHVAKVILEERRRKRTAA